MPLVSIIIPCYNAERWIAEAIQSCLDQTYRPIEIIVIDDGSTDGSLDVIKGFGDAVRWETGPNRGGNAARNRGFALSKGEWIQWLDADDILTPGKIEHQISSLRESKADVATGAWQYLVEMQPQVFVEGPIKQARLTDDVISGLLDLEGWSPPYSYLMSRNIVETIGGWNEALSCLQDVDFILRIAMQGAYFILVPHQCGYYRRPHCSTVSTSDRSAFMRNCFGIYNQVYLWSKQKGWTTERRHVLAQAYAWLARYYFEHDKAMFEHCLGKIYFLEPNYVPVAPPGLRLLTRMFGYRSAEHIALVYRRVKQLMKRPTFGT